MKLGAAAVGAIGLGGLTAVVGAATLWVRLQNADVPREQAIDVVPDGQLIVIGGRALVVYLLIALAAVLLIYLLEPTGQFSPFSAVGVGLLAAAATVYAIAWTDLSWFEVLPLFVIAVLVAGTCLLIGARRYGRLPFAVAVFASVMVFGALLSFFRATAEPQVQLAALLTKAESEGIKGIFVADTGERIYLARPLVVEEGEERGLYAINRSDNMLLAIAPPRGFESPEDEEAAKIEAVCLLVQLREDASRLREQEVPEQECPSDQAVTGTE